MKVFSNLFYDILKSSYHYEFFKKAPVELGD